MPTALMIGEDTTTKKTTAVKIDGTVGGIVVTEHTHHEVHEGEAFNASYLVPHGSEVANDAAQDFLFVTGTKTAHAFINIAVGGDCDALLYEGTTASANGTGLAELNLNRTSTNTATATAFHTPTVTTEGTLLQQKFLPGGVGPLAPGSSHSAGAEWILKASTKYLVRVTNRSGGAIQLSIMAEWYEE